MKYIFILILTLSNFSYSQKADETFNNDIRNTKDRLLTASQKLLRDLKKKLSEGSVNQSNFEKFYKETFKKYLKKHNNEKLFIYSRYQAKSREIFKFFYKILDERRKFWNGYYNYLRSTKFYDKKPKEIQFSDIIKKECEKNKAALESLKKKNKLPKKSEPARIKKENTNPKQNKAALPKKNGTDLKKDSKRKTKKVYKEDFTNKEDQIWKKRPTKPSGKIDRKRYYSDIMRLKKILGNKMDIQKKRIHTRYFDIDFSKSKNICLYDTPDDEKKIYQILLVFDKKPVFINLRKEGETLLGKKVKEVIHGLDNTCFEEIESFVNDFYTRYYESKTIIKAYVNRRNPWGSKSMELLTIDFGSILKGAIFFGKDSIIRGKKPYLKAKYFWISNRKKSDGNSFLKVKCLTQDGHIHGILFLKNKDKAGNDCLRVFTTFYPEIKK